MKFRTKPETVDAIRLADNPHAIVAAMFFAFGGEWEDYDNTETVTNVRDNGGITIPVQGGLDMVPFGHWLVVRADGSMFGVPPAEFAQAYVPIITPQC